MSDAEPYSRGGLIGRLAAPSVMAAGAYWLAHIEVCLACGDRAMEGTPHICATCASGQEGQWGGDRFVYKRTREEVLEAATRIAKLFGESHAHAQSRVPDTHDYTDLFLDLLRALRGYLGSTGEHMGKCLNINYQSPNLAIDIGWARVAVTCPWCQVHLYLGLLSCEEDRRWGLSPGSTWTELERITRERKMRGMAAKLAGLDVGTIVRRSLEGDPC